MIAAEFELHERYYFLYIHTMVYENMRIHRDDNSNHKHEMDGCMGEKRCVTAWSSIFPSQRFAFFFCNRQRKKWREPNKPLVSPLGARRRANSSRPSPRVKTRLRREG